jgi:hypothetical protein
MNRTTNCSRQASNAGTKQTIAYAFLNAFTASRHGQKAALPLVIGCRSDWFRKSLARLRLLLPPAYPVVVHARATTQNNHDGTCTLHNGRFYIHIDKYLSDEAATDVLLHEWAHALSWDDALERAAKSEISDAEFQRLAHGRKWGIAYSRVYIAYTTQIIPHLETDSVAEACFQVVCESIANVVNKTSRRRK